MRKGNGGGCQEWKWLSLTGCKEEDVLCVQDCLALKRQHFVTLQKNSVSVSVLHILEKYNTTSTNFYTSMCYACICCLCLEVLFNINKVLY